MIRLALGLLALGLVSIPAEAGPAVDGARAATELSAQTQRPRTRLRVYPDRRPLLYRDCDFKLVQQWRPGGAVIVPWQRCWWVRG
jgi:hypothetical protein